MKPLFRSPKDQPTHSRSGIAFIVEMLILLILVAGCLSVLIQAFAFAHQQGEENSATVKAVHLASSTAERFSADPNSIPEVEIISDFAVYTTVKSEQQTAGTLYRNDRGISLRRSRCWIWFTTLLWFGDCTLREGG